MERSNHWNANEFSPVSRFGSVELNQVDLESVDRAKEFGKGRVLENSDEEGFARMRSDSRGLEGEPVGGVEGW